MNKSSEKQSNPLTSATLTSLQDPNKPAYAPGYFKSGSWSVEPRKDYDERLEYTGNQHGK